MKKFIEFIKKKWLIDTTKTFLLIALLIIAFIAIHIGMNRLNLSPIDVTESKLYSLTEESKNKIKDVSSNVTIYFFGVDEDAAIVNFAKQYTKVNDKISVQAVNYSENPDLYQDYGVSEDNTVIIVQAPEQYKLLVEDDFTDYDYATGESTDLTEQKITNAILDTTANEKPVLYFLTGHNESEKITRFQAYLSNEINEIKTLNLLSDSFPEDCDCLIIANPTSDFQDSETNLIIDYINKGGNILWLNGAPQEEYPNIQKVLSLYGASIPNGTIRETSASRIIGVSSYFTPDVSYHKITQNFSSSNAILLFDSSRIDIVDDETLDSLNVTATPFIKSSDTSYFRTDYSNTSQTKADNEEEGPFNIGVEFTKKIDNNESKLILYSDLKFATDSITIGNSTQIPLRLFNNKDLLLNTVAYLTDREDAITIRKDTGAVSYTATQQQDLIIRLIIFIVPLLLIVLGFVIWLIRRRKK